MGDRLIRPIRVAVLALGGQGGGVLADWLVRLGALGGHIVQATSVPGVAQRTGTTLYYLEFLPEEDAAGRGEPVLALTPMSGDIDLVVASELMECGRAIQRGLVTRDRTVLVTSTHRVYAISEKSAPGDGRADASQVLAAARGAANRLIALDMEAATDAAGSAISAVMLGAIAASRALPFTDAQFEAAIRDSGLSVTTNLAGFHEGRRMAAGGGATPPGAPAGMVQPTTAAGMRLRDRVVAELPAAVHATTLEGVRRLMDYQDAAYAQAYLDRLGRVLAVEPDGGDFRLTGAVARNLALWMSYEDTIRVAQLKTRASRFARVRAEVRAQPGQQVTIREFMHPRLREACELMPPRIGRRLFESGTARRLLKPFFARGREVVTTRVGWFAALVLIAGLRPFRRGTWRFRLEEERIGAWLAAILAEAPRSPRAALEVCECQSLIKGYGETHERGLRNYERVLAAFGGLPPEADAPTILRRLREAALHDEDGAALAAALAELTPESAP